VTSGRNGLILALATCIALPLLFKISAPAVPMYRRKVYGPVLFWRFFPGTNWRIKTLLPGKRGTLGRDTLVDRLLSYCYSILESLYSNLDLMWGSATAHHSSCSAKSCSCSVRVASCRQPSPPSDTPSAAGKLYTSYLKAIQAGG
jgi:hypothetical protein